MFTDVVWRIKTAKDTAGDVTWSINPYIIFADILHISDPEQHYIHNSFDTKSYLWDTVPEEVHNIFDYVAQLNRPLEIVYCVW